MTNYNKVNFINYYTIDIIPAYKYTKNDIDILPKINIPAPIDNNNTIKNKPKLLINIFDKDNPNTDYKKIINLPILKNALFIYLANNENCGYAGGKGDGTAEIGDYKDTFGIITGHYDDVSKIPKILNAYGNVNGGFQKLDEKEKFTLFHRHDKKIYIMTPKEAIDYLLSQLSELIIKNKYEYVILPCDLNRYVSQKTVTIHPYKKYTLGSGIFNTAESVKGYIYDSICAMTQATSPGGLQLVTDFLK